MNSDKDGFRLQKALIMVRHGDRTSMSVTEEEINSICDLSEYVKPLLDSYRDCIQPEGNQPTLNIQVESEILSREIDVHRCRLLRLQALITIISSFSDTYRHSLLVNEFRTLR